MGIKHLLAMEKLFKKESVWRSKTEIRRILNMNAKMLQECLSYFLSHSRISKRIRKVGLIEIEEYIWKV